MNRNWVRHIIILLTLALLTMAGSLRAQQTTGQFVIKWNDTTSVDPLTINYHFLAHVGSGTSYALQDVTTFDPATCLWISDNQFITGGTNKNYYFYDGTNAPRFLCAPTFVADGALALSTTMPRPDELDHPEYKYYFYKWDSGLGRGVQYIGDCATDPATCAGCGHVWGQGECWDVYWVAYHAGNDKWQLSSKHYNLSETYLTGGEARGGRYSQVTTTVHAADTVTVGDNSGLKPFAGFELEYQQSHQVTPTIYPYSYNSTEAYTTYVFDGIAHHFYGNPVTDHQNAPAAQPNGTDPNNPNAPVSYAWRIAGDGAGYLTIDDATSATPTITYSNVNNDVHKTATLTLTVTYADGAKQKASATILVKTPCHNPTVSSNAEVTWVGATVSWTPTAESYRIYWKKQNNSNWNDSITVGNVTSYTITGLDYGTTYQYKVRAIPCGAINNLTVKEFTTLAEPGLMVGGAIFGGGRMADVGGDTEVTIINCDSIGAIYGGNDIAGAVQGANGSTITLGTNATTGEIRLGSVYGGGNGYYAYNGTSFVAASSSYNAETVEVGASVKAMTQSNQVGEVVWTNNGTGPKLLNFPSIIKSAITVTNNYIYADSIFGGAKNAFLTYNDYRYDGSLITINGGTILTVFGGNNIGGGQGYAKHHVVVNKTTTNLVPDIVNTATTGYGRTFGIRQLYGGGNKVAGSTTVVDINGGQLDEVFAGGNSADVYAANVTVECTMAAVAQDGITYGETYSNAIATYANDAIIPLANYAWDGIHGIYNVRTLFGGNNKAAMADVPNISLLEGSVGTVYGGGNEGNMDGLTTGHIDTTDFRYGTKVVLNSDKMMVDYLYGGCRMSSVVNSTWVELRKGHVGYVYGGCNISGDVGSTRVNPDGPTYPATLEDQKVRGATYVTAGGNTGDNIIVWKNLFAGSNGYYDCSSDGIHYGSIVGNQYVGDNLFDDPTGQYAGLEIPTHNETNVFVSDGATVKGNVYAGGNLAPVGFDDDQGAYRGFPELVGLASVYMDGGRVEKNVYGGGNMADIYGINVVSVSGGTIVEALYGGNDRAGQVAEKTKRILPPEYYYASDDHTLLHGQGSLGVKTYVGVSGDANIGTVYGGGNGDYIYGGEGGVQFCGLSPKLPIQSYTFVDIHINGSANNNAPGYIGTVYGGGNGVTVRHGVTVFLNVKSTDYENDDLHVGTIFGGNNKGNLDIVPDIRLVHGKVGTVYGGCNQGAMEASENGQDENGNTVNHLVTVGGYPNIGSYVRLRETYDPDGNPSHFVDVDAQVTEAVYGGCRMNGVTRNSLVLVEGGDFTNTLLFGGSDISGDVHGDSRVAVVGGTVGNIYGGGNGNYIYTGIENTDTYSVSDGNTSIATGVSGAPTCANSGVDILGGQMGASGNGNAGNAFGGGWGERTRTIDNVEVNIGPATASSWTGLPIIYGNVYGGSALGEVNTGTLANKNTTVNFLNGTLHGNLYGGGLGRNADQANGITAVEAKVYGKVYVNISNSTQAADKCFIDLRDANIFGCNNTNGSPQDDVTVHVYKTAYNYNDYPEGDNYTSQVTPNSYYAIDQVFGGGNQADYRPQAVAEGATSHKTHVWVHDCSNTIRRVFSGGNAAYAEGVETTIEGGRFDYVFGGGNGEVTAANIGAGGTNLLVQAGVVNHLFGGSNSQGNILGPVVTTVSGENYVAAGENVDNPCNENIDEFFGGANLAELGTEYNPVSINTTIECGSGLIGHIYGGCNLADIVGDVTLTIRGGIFSEAYGGSKGRLAQDAVGQEGDENYQPAVTAKAANIDGDVKLNLEGGKITDAFGGSNINGNITGNITVNVVDYGGDCGLDLTNVYGSGNLTAYTPTNANATSPVVNVIHTGLMDDGTPVGIHGNVYGGGKGASATVTANPIVNIGYNEATMSSYVTGITLPASLNALVSRSVFGGGDAAPVAGNTEVNVYSGEIVQKLVGGGNAADVSGDVTVNISGGLLCSDTNLDNVGVYGGCNTTGTVGGSVELNITGTAVIGVEANVDAAQKPVNVHGGGYGHATAVTGNVTINYGDIAVDESLFPKLYGNLYGGSALGSVNGTATNKTNIYVLNGSIVSKKVTLNPEEAEATTYYYSGNIFGGGLGQKAQGGNAAIAAVVNGEVHVNIGEVTTAPSTGLKGKATLIGCNIYGCNNQYGSPLDNVYVDVYQTAHITGTNTVDDEDYAILRVFGGGNEAHYIPLNNNTEKRTHVYIHGCENTIKFVYGGSNAADALGVESIIEGGHFSEVYGGGNGLLTPANIGDGSIGFIILGGHVNFLFEGNNKQGEIGGTPYVPILPQGYIDNCSALTVDSYYFGDNEAEHIGDIVNTITCDQASQFNYKYVYAGSRWAVVYGDVKLTVQGGNIRYLFGGSKGYFDEHIPADIRRYPSVAEIDTMNHYHPGYYSANLRAHMVAHPELAGTGGNVELIINGGTIGEVIGGCDELGTVDGTITVIVDQIDGNCPLFIGNVYGANNLSDCVSLHTDPDGVSTPKVSIIKGTIGGSAQFNYDASHPNLTQSFEGNVYGGGNEGKVTSNPKVIVGDGTTGVTATPVTVGGSVFGGGNKGNVIGNSKVVVVPERHSLAYTQPTCGTISVAYTRGDAVASGDPVGEDVDLRIIATPDAATQAGGYLFTGWHVTTAEDASVAARVEDPSAVNTLFTMGTGDATLSATFTQVSTKALNLMTSPEGAGTFKVDGVAQSAGTTSYIPIGATVNVQALHNTGYIFKEWTVTGATLSSVTSSVTSFVMGDTDVTLTAVFDPVYTLTMVSNPNQEGFTLKVNGANYTGALSYREGTMVTVQAKAAEGYAFLRWEVAGSGSSVGNVNAATTSFTMGTANTTLTAVFAPTHTFTYSADEHGTVTVTDILGQPVPSGAAIGEGATLNIVGTPDEGYVFDGWTFENGTTGTISQESPTTFTMGNANVELKGNFTARQ